jgi:MoxR-like ATPase
VEEARPVLSAADIIALQQSVREVPISDHLMRYALTLVRQTRAGEKGVPDFVSDQLSWGAGPRAVQFLIVGAKARALLQGRSHVAVEDLQALAAPVLRHRIVVGFAAESEGVTPDAIIRRIIDTTPSREDELTRDARFQTIFAS